MRAFIEIAGIVWMFIAAAVLLGIVLSFAVASSDEEQDELVRAAGWALVWPVWLARQVLLMVAWALRADR